MIILLFLLTSCALSNLGFSSKKDSGMEQVVSATAMTNEDYKDHLQHFERLLHESGTEEFKKINVYDRNYLLSLANELVAKNELFFTKQHTPEIEIINTQMPSHFSLPGRKVYLSSGLISKYLKNEKLLLCVLAYEMIRSEKMIYEKTQIIPTGVMNSSRIVSLLRLPVDKKIEIHKWAFHLLKRVGVDADSYLSWLQIQNRNSLDFSVMLGDSSVISREEAMFKSFLIDIRDKTAQVDKYERSSREFYSFINRMKR